MGKNKPETQRAYMQRYQLKNRERLTAYAKAHRAKWQDLYNARAKAYRAKNREKINARRNETRRIAGLITPEEYDRRLAEQGGTCAICQEAPRAKTSPGHTRRRSLCVDHDHRTGAVRGLLCHRCNSAIGLLKDDVALLEKAAAYLMRLP